MLSFNRFDENLSRWAAEKNHRLYVIRSIQRKWKVRTQDLTTKWRVGRVHLATPPLTSFCSEPFDWFFRGYREYAFIITKTSRIENLLFRLRSFKKPFFCPATTYSRLCSADHTCIKILFVEGFLRTGVIYSKKVLESVCHPRKHCKLFPQALIYLKGAMLTCRLMPP